jgi:hypothetical protein
VFYLVLHETRLSSRPHPDRADQSRQERYVTPAVAGQFAFADLTSTYFESDVERGHTDLRQYGYSRDKRGDCRQVVIALIVTPEGFPLSYEVLSGAFFRHERNEGHFGTNFTCKGLLQCCRNSDRVLLAPRVGPQVAFIPIPV